MALIDLTGQRFGRWTVQGLCSDSGKVKYWNCLCDCGGKKRVFGGDLKRGGSLSCGCLALESKAARMRSHGMSYHPAYRNWIYCKDRCENPASDSFAGYGAKGISVCERWSSSFDRFWEDMGPTWRKGLTLDRIDNAKGYEPSNCRWATSMEQANNRGDNRIIETPDGPLTISQAARRFNVKRVTLGNRVNAGWPSDRLFDPVQFNVRWHKHKTSPE